MAYDREHGLLVWGGTLPGAEQWTSTLRMAETENPLPPPAPQNDTADWDVQDLLDHYTDVIQAHHANGNSAISTRCKLEYVKFNRVDVDGHYVDQTTFRNDFAPVSGGMSTVHHPNQICLVVTLTTAVSRPPANRGRIFSPMPAMEVAADGLISAQMAENIAAEWKAFIEALSDVPGVDTASSPGAVVMSKVGTGLRTRRISGVRVGRVLDTQRRRRRSLPENYELEDVDQGVF